MMASQLPSPSSSASLSPRQPASLGMSRHPSDHSDHSVSANEERSPLDIRREKNRIKQRNLRLRRANQMANLEETVASLSSKSKQLEEREQVLGQWVRQLEEVLLSRGDRDSVDRLRRTFQPEQPRDALATLASAASFQGRPRWEDDSVARKRRRDDEYSGHIMRNPSSSSSAPVPPPHSHHPHPAAMHQQPSSQQQQRLPSPSRMRIDQLVTPLSGRDSWWADYEQKPRLPPTPHMEYEHKRLSPILSEYEKPRLAALPSIRTPSPATERRPMSSSSSAGTRPTWSPVQQVQSINIRL